MTLHGAKAMTPDEISRWIREGRLVPDSDFDAWLPDSVRAPSARYWTQVGVAMRVAGWLEKRGVSTVLDVGSGAGKFCVVGALRGAIAFTGIEQRAHLVDAANSLAEAFLVTGRVAFVAGGLEEVDFGRFDALYFYNPLGENVAPPCHRLDRAIEMSRAKFQRDAATIEHLLGSMSSGTYLVTYNGCGTRIPDSYDLVHAKVAGHSLLRLWLKAHSFSKGGYWLELGDSTLLRPPCRSHLSLHALHEAKRSFPG